MDAAAAKPNVTDGSGGKAGGAGAPTYNAATAQTAAAVALPAAANGTSAAANGAASAASTVAGASGRADSASSSAGDSAPPPAAPGVAQDAGVATLAATPSAAVPVSNPAAAAAAQTASALADLGGANKHSRGGNADSSVPGTTSGGPAGAAQLIATSATTADANATPTPTLKVSAPMGTPEFAQGLADRLSLMVDNNLNGAKLQVNPPQLGPVDVRIAVQGDQAQVWLSAHSAVTRDALASSSERLREMLGAQGFSQVSVDISQRSFQERTPHAQHYEWTPSASSTSTASVSSSVASMPRLSSGAVDAYA
jgi:flagellar hook-length control protein FliK